MKYKALSRYVQKHKRAATDMKNRDRYEKHILQEKQEERANLKTMRSLKIINNEKMR